MAKKKLNDECRFLSLNELIEMLKSNDTIPRLYMARVSPYTRRSNRNSVINLLSVYAVTIHDIRLLVSNNDSSNIIYSMTKRDIKRDNEKYSIDFNCSSIEHSITQMLGETIDYVKENFNDHCVTTINGKDMLITTSLTFAISYARQLNRHNISAMYERCEKILNDIKLQHDNFSNKLKQLKQLVYAIDKIS